MNDENTPLLSAAPETPLRDRQLRTLLIAGAAIVLLLLFVGLIASRSMPGDALYGTKTLMEDWNGGLRFGEESRAAYQADLMKTRLEEVKDLVSRNAADADAWNAFTSRVEQHRDALAKSTASGALANTAKLAVLSDFASLADAIEQVSESDARFDPYSETLEEVRSDVVRDYRATADAYATEAGKDEVFSYIKDRLGAVSEALKDPNVSQDAVNDADVYVSRVEPALQSGDLGRAIAAIEEAFRFIKVDLYAGDVLQKAAPQSAPAATSTASSTTEASSSAETTPAPSPSQQFLFSQ